MRDLSHHDAIPRHAVVRADGGGGAIAASRLVALRHGPCRLSAEADDGRGTGGGIRLVLPPAVLACLDLAAAAARLAGRRSLPGDVVPLQAVELALVSAHSPPL